MLKKDDSAVSPVIGTVLMVAITVILAAVIAAFGFGFTGFSEKGPTSSIHLSSAPETNLKIQHQGGDRLKSGDWKISIVKAGDPPQFRTSSTDFIVGDMIITHNLTSGSGIYTVTNSSIQMDSPAPTIAPETKYDVKIIVYPFKTLIVDAVVSVR